MFFEQILSSIAFVTEWTSAGSFWLTFLGRSLPSTTLGFRHSSLISTSLSKSSKFPMSSLSIPSSSSSTLAILSEFILYLRLFYI